MIDAGVRDGIKEILESANSLYTKMDDVFSEPEVEIDEHWALPPKGFKSYYVNDGPVAFPRSTELRGATAGVKYPPCFLEHRAPKSVVRLFTIWVKLIDKTSNGIIPINLQHQIYSNHTAQKAIKWLGSHGLIFKKSVGGGQGVASRYHIRWSFDHGTVTKRQIFMNHKSPFIRKLTYTPITLEEQSIDSKLKIKKTSIFSQHENEINNQKHKTLVEKSTRWVLAQMRKHTDNKDAITAVARGVRSLLKRNKIFAGPELKDLVDYFIADDYEGKSTGMIYRMVSNNINNHIYFLDSFMKERSMVWRNGLETWENTAVTQKPAKPRRYYIPPIAAVSQKSVEPPIVENSDPAKIDNSLRTLQVQQRVKEYI